MRTETFIAILLLVSALPSIAGEIAFSFDDAPTGDSNYMTGEERSRRLLSALSDTGVEAVFFVTTWHIDNKGAKRLNAYTDSGHWLAHHSHSHRSASKLSHDEYMADFALAHNKLTDFDNRLNLHRFPYLHYGKDAGDVERLHKAVTAEGYRDGYVTIDTADWYLNSLIVEAGARGRNINAPAVRDFYINNLWQTIEFYDELAQRSLGRSPKHVILLHENDAAALFFPDLVKKIRAEGWKVISPTEAYTDAISKTFPSNIYNKQGRIAALAYEKGLPEEALKSPLENLEAVKRQFETIIEAGH